MQLMFSHYTLHIEFWALCLINITTNLDKLYKFKMENQINLQFIILSITACRTAETNGSCKEKWSEIINNILLLSFLLEGRQQWGHNAISAWKIIKKFLFYKCPFNFGEVD